MQTHKNDTKTLILSRNTKNLQKIKDFIKIIFDLFARFRYLLYICNRFKKVSVPKALTAFIL